MLGLLGLRIFEACGADLGEAHGHRVLKVGSKVVVVPLPPAMARAIDRAVDERDDGPILRNARDVRIAARHAAPRTTIRYNRARKNLDRHPNYILAAFRASGR